MFTIAGYQITEQLFESAHSLVYRGYRDSDECPVVLKILKGEYPSPEELARFRAYARETHPNVLQHYIEIGPKLISAIRKAQGDNLRGFYKNLMRDMIKPVIVLSGSCHSEQAFEMYRDHTVKLCEKYTPELLDEFLKVIEADIEFMEAV